MKTSVFIRKYASIIMSWECIYKTYRLHRKRDQTFLLKSCAVAAVCLIASNTSHPFRALRLNYVLFNKISRPMSECGHGANSDIWRTAWNISLIMWVNPSGTQGTVWAFFVILSLRRYKIWPEETTIMSYLHKPAQTAGNGIKCVEILTILMINFVPYLRATMLQN